MQLVAAANGVERGQRGSSERELGGAGLRAATRLLEPSFLVSQRVKRTDVTWSYY